MNNNKRVRRITIVLTCILIPLGAFGFGYFFGGETISNKTLGNTLEVKGEIGGTLKEAELESIGLVPGDSIDKTVDIKPKCTAPSLIRVKVEPYWDGMEGKKDNNISTKIAINYDTKLKEGSDESYWYKHTDGYFYYMGIKNGSETINLVNGFLLENEEDVNDYQGKKIKINVVLDIVQAKYNAYENKWNIEDDNLKEELNKLCKTVE